MKKFRRWAKVPVRLWSVAWIGYARCARYLRFGHNFADGARVFIEVGIN